MLRKRFWGASSFSFLIVTGCFFLVAGGQQRERNDKSTTPIGTPLLWHEPADIASRNLYLGPGGEAMRPDISKVTFVEEKQSSGTAKFRVRDAVGREWVVKVGGEAQAEVAASRIVWALGYYTDINYLVPRVDVAGKGNFENARGPVEGH